MLLAARALGLGATLTTLYLQFEREAEAALGLPPDVHSYALLPIGYPMGRFGPVRRVPLTGVVFENRWGQAYPTRQVTGRRLRLLRLANGVSPRRRRAASRSMHAHRGGGSAGIWVGDSLGHTLDPLTKLAALAAVTATLRDSAARVADLHGT
jgi:hypothetical protein